MNEATDSDLKFLSIIIILGIVVTISLILFVIHHAGNNNDTPK